MCRLHDTLSFSLSMCEGPKIGGPQVCVLRSAPTSSLCMQQPPCSDRAEEAGQTSRLLRCAASTLSICAMPSQGWCSTSMALFTTRVRSKPEHRAVVVKSLQPNQQRCPTTTDSETSGTVVIRDGRGGDGRRAGHSCYARTSAPPPSALGGTSNPPVPLWDWQDGPANTRQPFHVSRTCDATLPRSPRTHHGRTLQSPPLIPSSCAHGSTTAVAASDARLHYQYRDHAVAEATPQRPGARADQG